MAEWIINTRPVRVLGDATGPHSTAIIVGSNCVLACAHSLNVEMDDTKRSTKKKSFCQYVEQYWIQPALTKDRHGRVTTDGRIPIILHTFHVNNDWALFTRADKSEIAIIDCSALTNPGCVLVHKSAVVLHIPVSLEPFIRAERESVIGWQRTGVHIQTDSSHHVMYEGRGLICGSSGGGVYVYPNSSVLGLHSELINEAEYGNEVDTEVISTSTKRVDSLYNHFADDSSAPATKKVRQVDSESVFSHLAGGNNGNGRALIVCKFPRLMHYIRELEDGH